MATCCLGCEQKLTNWQLVAASVTGVAHLRAAKDNEDAWLSASRTDGTLLLSVADGAGSAPCAALGSKLAVSAAIDHLSRTPLPAQPEGFPRHLLETLVIVRRTLTETALEHDLPLRAFASTLLVVLVTEHHLAALQLGDGAIIQQAASGDLTLLTSAQHGRYAGETSFVTSVDYLEQASCIVAPKAELRGLALMTDGLEPIALQTSQPFVPFFDPLFRFASNPDTCDKPSQLLTFLSSERVSARSHDDKTLLLAVHA